MGREEEIEHPEESPDNQITVSVPLDEYFELLSAREILNKPVRTHAQAAEERVTKVLDEATSKLTDVLSSKTRYRLRTQNSINVLQTKILLAAGKFGNYHHSDTEIRPGVVFRSCINHYRFFYDKIAREKMIQVNEDTKIRISHISIFSDLKSSDLYPLSTYQEPPNLIEYQGRLHWQLRPLLPVYVATYFITRSDLLLPPEINQAISSPS